jgi:N-acetylmuramic acid 6-phosphate (MurNAc-6-P) etherase
MRVRQYKIGIGAAGQAPFGIATLELRREPGDRLIVSDCGLRANQSRRINFRVLSKLDLLFEVGKA